MGGSTQFVWLDNFKTIFPTAHMVALFSQKWWLWWRCKGFDRPGTRFLGSWSWWVGLSPFVGLGGLFSPQMVALLAPKVPTGGLRYSPVIPNCPFLSVCQHFEEKKC